VLHVYTLTITVCTVVQNCCKGRSKSIGNGTFGGAATEKPLNRLTQNLAWMITYICKTLFFACPLFRKFREPDKFAKITGRENLNTVAFQCSGSKNGWQKLRVLQYTFTQHANAM